MKYLLFIFLIFVVFNTSELNAQIKFTNADTLDVDTTSTTAIVLKLTPNLVQFLNGFDPRWRNLITQDIKTGVNTVLNRMFLIKQQQVYNAYQELSPDVKKMIDDKINQPKQE